MGKLWGSNILLRSSPLGHSVTGLASGFMGSGFFGGGVRLLFHCWVITLPIHLTVINNKIFGKLVRLIFFAIISLTDSVIDYGFTAKRNNCYHYFLRKAYFPACYE